MKRKLSEQAEAVDKEFLNQANKMSKTMENLTRVMTGCFQMMSAMFGMQMHQQSSSYGYQQNMATSMNPQCAYQFPANNAHVMTSFNQSSNSFDSNVEQEH